jgi:hypothetical protein
VVQAALASVSSRTSVNEAIAVKHGRHHGVRGRWLGWRLHAREELRRRGEPASVGTAAPRGDRLRRPDSLPHNGAVITMLGICRLTHREAYFDMFMVSVVGPLLALVVVLIVGTTFGSF